MKSICIFSLAFGAVVLSGCSHKSVTCTSDSKLDNLKSLNAAEAIADADGAYTHGDRRLLGVYGVGLEVPGLVGNPDSYRYGIRLLEGTGDAVCDDQERSLNQNARMYAKKYNEELISQEQKAGN